MVDEIIVWLKFTTLDLVLFKWKLIAEKRLITSQHIERARALPIKFCDFS